MPLHLERRIFYRKQNPKQAKRLRAFFILPSIGGESMTNYTQQAGMYVGDVGNEKKGKHRKNEIIQILDRQERIVDFLDNATPDRLFWNAKHSDTTQNAQNTFEFYTPAGADVAKFLQFKHKVIIRDLDGYFLPFTIEKMYTTDANNQLTLYVYAEGEHYELRTEQPLPPQTLTGTTAASAAQTALSGTRWQLGFVQSAATNDITTTAFVSPLSLLNTIATTFGLNLRFRVETSGNRIVARYVDLLQMEDVFSGKEIVFGKDLTSIERKENTMNVCDRLVGYGPADSSGKLVTFESVNNGLNYVEDTGAYQRWNVDGRHIYGIYAYNPTGSKQVTSQDVLTATQKELQNRINSTVEYTVGAVTLEQISGFEHEKIRKGQLIHIKDEHFVPALYLQANVLDEYRHPNERDKDSFKLGNFKEIQPGNLQLIQQLQEQLNLKANVWSGSATAAENAVANGNVVLPTSALKGTVNADQNPISSSNTNIKNGMLTATRSDGFQTLDNGNLNIGFEIQGATPPSTTGDVAIVTRYFSTQNIKTNGESCQLYTFKRTARYVTLELSLMVSVAGDSATAFVIQSGDPTNTWLGSASATSATETAQTITIDLGVPDGSVYALRLYLKSNSSSNTAYMSVTRIYQNG